VTAASGSTVVVVAEPPVEDQGFLNHSKIPKGCALVDRLLSLEVGQLLVEARDRHLEEVA